MRLNNVDMNIYMRLGKGEHLMKFVNNFWFITKSATPLYFIHSKNFLGCKKTDYYYDTIVAHNKI